MSGALFLLALLLLAVRREALLVVLCAAQGALLALAAALAGQWVAALLAGALAVVLPCWLRGRDAALPDAPAPWVVPLAGAALLALAAAAAPGPAMLPLAALLIGLLAMALRRARLAQAAGALTAVNAALLLAIGVGLPGLASVLAGGLAVQVALFAVAARA
jgi:hydrogenase-4 membrane subunit HyfE